MVAGKGIQILREHGIEVTEGVLREACTKLNEVFFHFIQTKTPFVVMKYAMTMDGKMPRTPANQSGLRVKPPVGMYRRTDIGIPVSWWVSAQFLQTICC